MSFLNVTIACLINRQLCDIRLDGRPHMANEGFSLKHGLTLAETASFLKFTFVLLKAHIVKKSKFNQL